MAGRRRKYDAQFKAKLVVESLKEERSVNEIAAEHDINPNLLRKWREELVIHADRVFDTSIREKELEKKEEMHDKEVDDLHRIIGELTVERDYLQRSCREAIGRSPGERRGRSQQ